MMEQKCIITLEDGSILEYFGEAQYNTAEKPKIRKISFTVPEEDSTERSADLPDDFLKIFNGFKR
jgi:hypothetical protein